MSALAKSAREALKSKARRLAGEKETKVDSTSVKRPEAFTAEGKTGKAPVNPRAYKRGGKVGKASGGYTGGSLPDPKEGLAASGASVSEKSTGFGKAQKASYAREEGYNAADRRAGKMCGGKVKERVGRKAGGGVTVINIGKGASDAPQKTPVPPPVPMPTPAAPPPMQSQMPIQQPSMMPSPAARNAPLALKTGGRVSRVAKSYKDMTAGAGSGEGRLQKTDIAKKRK